MVTGGINQQTLHQLMEQSDQIIMMGHGTPYGLLSMGQFQTYGNVINDKSAEILAERDNNIFIWCNADSYVKYHKLEGFFTGMFISEVAEAAFCGMPLAKQSTVDESNEAFVTAMRRYLDLDPRCLHAAVTREYGQVAMRNPVAAYNHERLYVRKGENNVCIPEEKSTAVGAALYPVGRTLLKTA